MAAAAVGLSLVGAAGSNSAASHEAALRRLCEGVRSAALVDAATGQMLFSWRPDDPLPPASTVKLMLMLVAAEELNGDRHRLQERVIASRRAEETGGQQVYLKEGESHALGDIALATAVHSANDAAVALAEGLFGSYERAVARMNARATDLGLTGTRYHTPHGLPPAWGQHGDRSTARDMARLGCAAVKEPLIMEWCSRASVQLPDRDFKMVNSNHLLGRVPGVDGLKTGYTASAGFCIIATAERGGRRLVCTILGATTRRVRENLAEKLFDYGFRHFVRKPIVTPGQTVGVRPSRSGLHHVVIAAADTIHLWQRSDVQQAPALIRLAVPDTLPASIKRGTRVGEVLVYRGLDLLGRAPARVERRASQSEIARAAAVRE